MTKEELLVFAKDQTEIFPKDSLMGEYLRQTIQVLEKDKKISQIYSNYKAYKYGALGFAKRILEVLENTNDNKPCY